MFKEHLEEHLLDLAWRQWSELGVAGVQRGYGKVAVALEELLLLTSTLANSDPRLRDEALDWCAGHFNFVSKSRLKNLLKASSSATQEAFGPFAATVNTLSTARWPGGHGVEPWSVKLSNKSRLPSLQKPAILHLQLRALMGVSARADVIAAFLAQPDPSFSASDLVYVGYTKRNVAQVLDSLNAAGVLRATRVRNQIRFQWAKRSEFEELLRPLPDRIPRWSLILNLVTALWELAVRLEGKSDTVCGVEAVAFLEREERTLGTLSVTPSEVSEDPGTTWGAFVQWALKHAEALAHARSSMLDGPKPIDREVV